MLATNIKMKQGCGQSNSLLEIDCIYIVGLDVTPQYYKKEYIYNQIKYNNISINVNIPPYPVLQPAISANGEKYVKSTPNEYQSDNLLSLPRE